MGGGGGGATSIESVFGYVPSLQQCCAVKHEI